MTHDSPATVPGSPAEGSPKGTWLPSAFQKASSLSLSDVRSLPPAVRRRDWYRTPVGPSTLDRTMPRKRLANSVLRAAPRDRARTTASDGYWDALSVMRSVYPAFQYDRDITRADLEKIKPHRYKK